ncbi:hypothetical protein [uncultured Tateyamaria sp.]|uniref:hypothetical protein n=1 Tax=uncultured Tateyamaria sp. TaxID=455651 RepID=UPI002613FB7E|nr:hypothetical protein [uncultured Tateyamaria sp.]
MIFEFDAPLPFMVAGAWSPFTDLGARDLQNGFADEFLEQVMVSSFALDGGAMICFSWLNSDNAPGLRIAEQLLAQSNDQLASVFLQFAVKHVEDVFFEQDWFYGLDAEARVRLDQLAADGIDPMGSVPSVPVESGLDLQLPRCSGSFGT